MKILIIVTTIIISASVQVHGKTFLEDPLTESEINSIRDTSSSINDTVSPANRQLIPNVIYNLFNNGVLSAQPPYELGSQAEVDLLMAERDRLLNQLSQVSQLNAQNAAGAAKVQAAKDTCNSKLAGLRLDTLATGRYYFHNDDANPKNWFEAKEFCRQKGMELVSVETQEEHNAITAKIKELLTGMMLTKDLFYWSGLNNLANRNDYVWTGTGRVATFFQWNLFELGAPNGYCDENCGELYAHTSLDNILWNDRVCSGIWRARFICELVKPCATLI